MRYFLGIDGGGTKTSFLLGDEIHILGAETAGGSNIIRLGEEAARDAMHQGIQGVCRTAGIEPREIAAVCAGVSGAASGDSREQIRRILAGLIPGKIDVVGDMVVAHEAALSGRAGIIIIAGTGSIAYGRNQAGHSSRSGGWGYMISDEGSGHWIGVQAVAAIVRSMGRGHKTLLAGRVLARWKLQSIDELVQFANASPPPDFAGLFPEVLALEDRDPLVRPILERAGVELANVAEPVYRTLWEPWTAVEIALCGGVFQNSVTVRELLKDRMRGLGLNAQVRLSEFDAAAGALNLARKLEAAERPETTSL